MIELLGSALTPSILEEIIFHNVKIVIATGTMKKLASTYDAVEKLAGGVTPIYGINTGFGAFAEVRINQKDQALLQENIILPHAVGVSEPLDFFSAKTLMLLRLNTLAQGYSGASLELIRHLTCLINANCAPFVPKKGSVGASGDLAPLAHLGLLLLGIGEAYVNHKLTTAQAALEHAGLSPLKLGVRDGLAIINGTQAMAAVAAMALKDCQHLALMADFCAATTLCALAGHSTPFDERIHALKPHPGQIATAANMRKLMANRKVANVNERTQDPYSVRCVPQVHGASKDVIAHVQEVVYREINSVTDNPLIFAHNASHEILSGGNFHGQYLALGLDYLAMAIAELANIADRRIELLINPQHSQGLPAFLIENGGLSSGYMMLQVTAAALVSENKILCHPASVDSIPTSASREDHVSMGMNAANKIVEVIKNTTVVQAIELMAAFQALDLRKQPCAGEDIQKIHQMYRKIVPFRTKDGLFRDDLTKTLAFFSSQQTKKLIKEIVKAK